MDYEGLNRADQVDIVKTGLKELETKHLGACMNVVTASHAKPNLVAQTCPQCGNRTVKDDPARNLEALTIQRDNLARAIKDFKAEYGSLLSEPAEPLEELGELGATAIAAQRNNGRDLHAVAGE